MRLKFISRLIVASLLALALTYPTAARAQRQDIDWNSGWKFLDSDAEPNASTADWANVDVPHTWDISGYRRGAGWYAKSFPAPEAWRGKRVFVFFEAVSIAAAVTLNGEKLGRHEGAFTAFCFELSSQLKFGQTNELRVRADNSKLGIPPDSADFNFNGGIYRPVHLLVCDPVCISPLDHASSGVYITQRQVNVQTAGIEVKTVVSNGQKIRATSRVDVEIFDARGQRVARSRTNAALEPGSTSPVVQTLSIAKPHLWNALRDPYLYSVRVRTSSGKQNDEIRQSFGVRTVGFSPDERFLLNGALYPIHGVNRHQDRKGKAWELSESDQRADVALIKELGATAVRLAHYPQSHVFLDQCDRDGLLLWEEIPVVNRILDTPQFSDSAKSQLTEMILQNYNHPSIMVWGLFNEVSQPADTRPERLIGELHDLAHTLDASRPTVGASNAPQLTAMNHAPDHIGFNIYPGWYSRTVDDFASNIEQRSQNMDGKRIALSEYGGGGSVIQHQEGEVTQAKANSKFHPEEYQTLLHQRAWEQMKDNPHLWGTFVWSMFDFAVEKRNEGDRPHINDKGLVTDDRKIRKDAFYFYKANWNPNPMVYIASRRMTPRKVATTQVKVFSNCAEVEILVNGKSLGSARPDSVSVFRWDNVTLAPGTNHVEARATQNGHSLSDSCDWVLETP